MTKFFETKESAERAFSIWTARRAPPHPCHVRHMLRYSDDGISVRVGVFAGHPEVSDLTADWELSKADLSGLLEAGQ